MLGSAMRTGPTQKGLTPGPSNGMPSASDRNRSSSCTAVGSCSNHTIRSGDPSQFATSRSGTMRDTDRLHTSGNGHPWTSGLRKRCMMAPSGRDALHAV